MRPHKAATLEEEAMKRHVMLASFTAAVVAISAPALAQKKYDPGASDTEIKIGKTIAAYFNKVNADGGVNGRKINFISYDDAYSPPKAVEQARKLVESDEVFLIFGALGTPSNTAIQKYMNAKQVPQLFVSSGATKWNDPQRSP